MGKEREQAPESEGIESGESVNFSLTVKCASYRSVFAPVERSQEEELRVAGGFM